LQTPPNVPESDDNLDSADKIRKKKKKQNQSSCSNDNKDHISKQSKACSTTNFIFKRREKILMAMNREHSMFMNCIPLTRDKLGPNLLAKIHSVV